MRAGDIVRYKPEVLERWVDGWEPPQDQRDYYFGELKIVRVLEAAGMLEFEYPATFGGGNWFTAAHKFYVVREAEPQKCQWKGCGKTHNEKGLCEV